MLLLKGSGLVKTVKFRAARYIGDPINAVRIFNDLKADELVFVDIDATVEKRVVSADLVRRIGDEAFMPFAVGGGITSVENIGELLTAGAEKIIINSSAVQNPDLIAKAAGMFGSQSIVVSVDVKRGFFDKRSIHIRGGSKKAGIGLGEHLRKMEDLGAGEIIINSIDNDGMMRGYDLDLIREVSESVSIPVIACGGAGNLDDLASGYKDGNASALAAGSMFVYHGPRKAILINYPDRDELNMTFKE